MKRGAVNKNKKFLHEHRCGIEIDDPNEGQHRYIVTFSLTAEELTAFDAALDDVDRSSCQQARPAKIISLYLRQAANRKGIQPFSLTWMAY